MTNDLSFIMAGLDRIEGHVLDSNGVIAGTSGTVAAGGTGSNGFRILGTKEAQNIGAPAPDIVAVTGDDAYLGGFIFPSANARQFALVCAVQGFDVQQYLGSGNSYNIGNSSVSFIDVTPFAPVNCALIIVGQAKSQQAGNVGTGIWSGYILAKVQGIPLGRESMAERAAGAVRMAFIISPTAAFPWGETFQQSVHGINTAVYVPWSSNYRKSLYRATGDGVTTQFGPLLYVPASTSLSDVVVYQNSYRKTTGWTVNTTTKMLTASPAPASSDVIAVYYDHI